MSRDQLTRNHDRGTDDKGHDANPSREHAPVAMVRAMLARGASDPRQIAGVITAHPQATQEILALLHRTAGNAFVQQVTALLASHGGLGSPRDIATFDVRSEYEESRATIDGPPKSAAVSDRFSEYQEARATIDHPHTAASESPWVERARGFNRAHPDNVRAFIESTGTDCIDEATGEPDPNKVARWQADHGVPPDGRIGEQTVRCAVSDPSRAL